MVYNSRTDKRWQKRYPSEIKKERTSTMTSTKKPIGMLIMILALVLVAVILVVVIVASTGGDDDTSDTTTTAAPISSTAPESTTAPESSSVAPDSSSTPESSSTEKPIEPVKPTLTETPKKADATGKITVPSADAATGLLIEVSDTNPYKYDLENIFKGDDQTTQDVIAKSDYKRLVSANPLWKTPGWTHYVRKETFAALQAMITTFASHAGEEGTLQISGYKATMSEAVTSPFITGNAISMLGYKGGTTGLNYGLNKVNLDGNMVTYDKWFAANAAKFGFVFEGLRGDNENMLPGYFRYVGSIHAAGVTAAESLSAYLAGIKDGTIKTATAADGSTWNLSYVAASTEENTEITVGANATYVVSGDNMGGFIVAVLAQ